MQRVLIIGSAGAGKSTFSQALADITQLPVIHLDREYWRPGWRETPKDEWKKRVRQLTSGERWVMDGNYGGTLPERIEAADTVVLLALPRLQCLLRVIRRGFRGRGKPRSDLNPGCNEKLPDLAFLKWIWSYPHAKLPGILEMLRLQSDRRTIVILRSSAEVASYLAAFASQ